MLPSRRRRGMLTLERSSRARSVNPLNRGTSRKSWFPASVGKLNDPHLKNMPEHGQHSTRASLNVPGIRFRKRKCEAGRAPGKPRPSIVELTVTGPLLTTEAAGPGGSGCMGRCPLSVTAYSSSAPSSPLAWDASLEGSQMIIDSVVTVRFHHAVIIKLEGDDSTVVSFTIPSEPVVVVTVQVVRTGQAACRGRPTAESQRPLRWSPSCQRRSGLPVCLAKRWG